MTSSTGRVSEGTVGAVGAPKVPFAASAGWTT